jgi:predicted dinucleotide-binding enzyme
MASVATVSVPLSKLTQILEKIARALGPFILTTTNLTSNGARQDVRMRQ